jgi:hypothetical protein
MRRVAGKLRVLRGIVKGFVRANGLEMGSGIPQPPWKHNPFRCFNISPEVIYLTVMVHSRFPLSLRQVEELLFERGIDIHRETVRIW